MGPAPLSARVGPAPLPARVGPAPLSARVGPAPLPARVGPAPLSARVGHKVVLRLLVWFCVICCYHAFFVLGMTGNGMLFLRRNVTQYHYQLKIIFIDAVFVCLQACVWQHLGKVSVIHVRILLYTEYLGKVSVISTCQNIADFASWLSSNYEYAYNPM